MTFLPLPLVAKTINKRLCKVLRPMALKNIPSVAVVATLLLGGCAFADNAMFPPLAPIGGDGNDKATLLSEEGPSEGGTTETGTFVGQKVDSLRNDLHQLQNTLGTQKD